ncbi:MAG: insulinase family protein [Thermoleophilia bacterium]|nr:insulinase family protein [Thermoleophilia bacterium]
MQNYVLSELDSGERVVSERVESVRSVSVGFWIGAGSRDERDESAGVTHFIEHLLFKGSRDHTAQEIAEIFDALGGELNAATSREHTVLYARVPDAHVATALDVMADMVLTPTFAELDSERDVVLEEIAMYEDTPQELVHDLFSEAVFGDDALGRPVIGSAEVIASIARGDVAGYHGDMYAGTNIVIASAGNLDHEELLALLERVERTRAGALAGSPPARPLLVQAPPPGLRFQRKDTEQYHVCVGAPGISRSDRRRFAASLLDAILGGSASSRLFQEIREKRGMAYSVYTFLSQYTDTGLIGFYVGTREENLGPCLEIAAEQIADVAAGNLRADELARAKENIKGRIMLSMESTSNRMSRLGKSLITDTELLSFERLIAEIDAVDAAAVSELAGLLLAGPRLAAAGIGPAEDVFRAAVGRMTPELEARAAAA